MKLTIGGCSRLWVSANGEKAPAPHEGRATCRGCPIGASLTTGLPLNPLLALKEEMFSLCARCGAASDRIIHRDTLGLCISCYNRHQEVLSGKNAKGNAPGLTKLLHTERISVTDGEATRVLTRRHVLGLPEVIVQRCRGATAPLAFGRPAVDWDAALDRLATALALEPWGTFSGAGGFSADAYVLRAVLPDIADRCDLGRFGGVVA